MAKARLEFRRRALLVLEGTVMYNSGYRGGFELGSI